MSDLPQPVESTAQASVAGSTEVTTKPLTPQSCALGSVISGVMAFGMYRMSGAIALSFAAHKIQSDNFIVQRISAAVRTLVIGMTTLGMGVFGVAALGLFALAIQLIIQKNNQPPTSKDS
ncbi:DUF3082 domain-containing protein [Phormidium sp. CLA17]|uniref:DUF3082 domain-containing protein n=1 Tax=Leptolyngbya sp. Cla-17 TaxID=2803751 RepID=UPI0014930016|nr:DUF3082 domain-containing protein [Leptolyngbya sp. Cla-17]MBM0742126.1 DUF3082 domain-containing protein [Leptolyngbya sp. Cla-17]